MFQGEALGLQAMHGEPPAAPPRAAPPPCAPAAAPRRLCARVARAAGLLSPAPARLLAPAVPAARARAGEYPGPCEAHERPARHPLARAPDPLLGTCTVRVPAVHHAGAAPGGRGAFIVMEHLALGGGLDQRELGRRMAAMHLAPPTVRARLCLGEGGRQGACFVWGCGGLAADRVRPCRCCHAAHPLHAPHAHAPGLRAAAATARPPAKRGAPSPHPPLCHPHDRSRQPLRAPLALRWITPLAARPSPTAGVTTGWPFTATGGCATSSTCWVGPGGRDGVVWGLRGGGRLWERRAGVVCVRGAAEVQGLQGAGGCGRLAGGAWLRPGSALRLWVASVPPPRPAPAGSCRQAPSGCRPRANRAPPTPPHPR